jgi:prepilin-type N-terminal cleavage/methylation domain-containing protein/prepilin-type processing-associated H-X9-DG protein
MKDGVSTIHIQSRRRAFTLIELLAVIAVILLLVGFLVPALRKGKSLGMRSGCGSNLQQMETAFRLFMSDNAGQYIRYDGASTVYIDNLQPYYSQIQRVAICPAAPQPLYSNAYTRGDATHSFIWNAVANGYNVSGYAINGFLYGYQEPYYGGIGYGRSGSYATAYNEELWFKTPGNVQRTAHVPSFGDACWVDAWPIHQDFGAQASIDPEYPNPIDNSHFMNRYLVNRHDKKINLSYADGHVEAVKLSMLWDQEWNATFERQGESPVQDLK